MCTACLQPQKPAEFPAVSLQTEAAGLKTGVFRPHQHISGDFFLDRNTVFFIGGGTGFGEGIHMQPFTGEVKNTPRQEVALESPTTTTMP